jgi:hypothetical protein
LRVGDEESVVCVDEESDRSGTDGAVLGHADGIRTPRSIGREVWLIE